MTARRQHDCAAVESMSPHLTASPPQDMGPGLIAQSPPQIGRVSDQCPMPAAFEKSQHCLDLRSHASFGKLSIAEIPPRLINTQTIEPTLIRLAEIDGDLLYSGRYHQQLRF